MQTHRLLEYLFGSRCAAVCRRATVESRLLWLIPSEVAHACLLCRLTLSGRVDMVFDKHGEMGESVVQLNASEKNHRVRSRDVAISLIIVLASGLLLASWLLTPKEPDMPDATNVRAALPGKANSVTEASNATNASPEVELARNAQAKEKSNAIRALNVIRATEDNDWQYQYGYRLPERYEHLTESELLHLVRQGDGAAAQMLASMIWDRTGSREEAAKYYEQAIERGSVGAIAELVSMYDTTMNPAVAKYYQAKFGRPLEPDLQEAYVWARTATYRGDLDATFATDRLKKVMTPKEVAGLESAAFENFMMLKARYKQITGRTLLPMDSDAQRKLFSQAAGAGG